MSKVSVQELCIDEGYNLISTLQAIDKGAGKICFITDDNMRLIGAVSDGDIRRALIKGIELNASVKAFANYIPVFAPLGTSKEDLIQIFSAKHIECIPLVDSDGVLCDVVFIHDVTDVRKNKNLAIIMAGGLGSRLGELTKEVPKPMLKIGDDPLLMHILKNFKRHGFTDINISVNYKGELIENYFQDGKPYGMNIKYLKEPKRLGTGGSIKLSNDIGELPFFVMNGDILTNIDLNKLMDFHTSGGYDMTVAVKPYSIKLAYGVLECEGNAVVNLREKPELSFMINAGIYCLNPSVVKKIPDDEYFEITELLGIGLNVGSYEITDYWMDIGKVDDYFKANEDFKNILRA